MTRKSARRHVVVLDVDGTCLQARDGVAKIPYNDPHALLRDQELDVGVIARAQHLQQHVGVEVRFLTGRSEALRDVTQMQLEAAGFLEPTIAMQEAWRGWRALQEHKQRWLEAWRAVLHIGDQDIDHEASRLSGVPFMHARDFATGCRLSYLWCWVCGCTSLRACRGGCSWASPRRCSNCAPAYDSALVEYVPEAA